MDNLAGSRHAHARTGDKGDTCKHFPDCLRRRSPQLVPVAAGRLLGRAPRARADATAIVQGGHRARTAGRVGARRQA